MRLLKRGRKLLRVRDKRALATSSCADRCCDGACPNYVRIAWCCDHAVVGWLWMNRPECPGHIPSRPSFRTDGPQVFRISDDPSQTCWATDPLPEGNVRTYADIPPAELILLQHLTASAEIVDNCADARCGPCPECCGSRYMPIGCGDNTNPPGEFRCCECGDGYTLTITETSQSSAVGTHYQDPCTVFPSIGSQPSWEVSATHTATFNFGCREVPDGNGGTTLQREVTGSSTIRIERAGHYATIRYRFPLQTGDPCFLESFSRGRDVFQNTDSVDGWVQFGGGEGCGLTVRQASRLGAIDFSLLGTTRGFGYGLNRYNLLGECSGQHEQWIPACSDELGGPDNFLCRMGVDRVGFSVQWDGNQSCNGGAFTESGSFVNLAGLRSDTSVNGQPLQETTWGGVESGSWVHSITWAVTGGEPCDADPCGQQNPAGLQARANTARLDSKPPATEKPLAALLEDVLQRRLRKGCNCGKR